MTPTRFEGHCRPCLIGSLPLTDYAQAARLVWEYTPEIPLWVQLPKMPGESITRQFAAGRWPSRTPPRTSTAPGLPWRRRRAEGFSS